MQDNYSVSRSRKAHKNMKKVDPLWIITNFIIFFIPHLSLIVVMQSLAPYFKLLLKLIIIVILSI